MRFLQQASCSKQPWFWLIVTAGTRSLSKWPSVLSCTSVWVMNNASSNHLKASDLLGGTENKSEWDESVINNIDSHTAIIAAWCKSIWELGDRLKYFFSRKK